MEMSKGCSYFYKKFQEIYVGQYKELLRVVERLPLKVCAVAITDLTVLRWRDVARAVRKARLPMTPASVSRVLAPHLYCLTDYEMAEFVDKMKRYYNSGHQN